MESIEVKLKEMENEIANLRQRYSNSEIKIEKRVDDLEKSFKSSKSSKTIKPDKSKGSSRKSTPATTPPPKKAENMDAQLGEFYGSTELRDSLKEAQIRLLNALTVLQRVREFVNNPCVRTQIGKLFNDISTMQQLFNRMMDRMEIPDSEDFFASESQLASAKSSATEVSKKPPK